MMQSWGSTSGGRQGARLDARSRSTCSRSTSTCRRARARSTSTSTTSRPPSTFGAGYGESPNATQHLAAAPLQSRRRLSRRAPQRRHHLQGIGAPAGRLEVRHGAAVGTAGRRPDRVPAGVAHDARRLAARRRRATCAASPSPTTAASTSRITADSARGARAADARIAQLRELVAESRRALRRAPLPPLPLAPHAQRLVEPQGLEHHESSDNRAPERGLTDPTRPRAAHRRRCSHEFVHSWNGKYRRPAGLATPDYQSRCTASCSGSTKG